MNTDSQPSSSRRQAVLAEIDAERNRQQAKWGAGEQSHVLAHLHDTADYGLPTGEDAVAAKRIAFDSNTGDWMRIISAEAGRLASAAVVGDRPQVRRYAIRLAAVLCALAESI